MHAQLQKDSDVKMLHGPIVWLINHPSVAKFVFTKLFKSQMVFKIGNDPVRQLPQIDPEAFRPEILFPEDEESEEVKGTSDEGTDPA